MVNLMSKFVVLDLFLKLMKATGEDFPTGVTLFVGGSVVIS
jgi:hypothetical protein